MSVDVVGSRGSGRSAFMRALELRLGERGWVVHDIRGVASLRSTPVAALGLSGIVELAAGRRLDSTIEKAGKDLAAQASNGRTVFFLDDWDDLDEASWGVVEYVRRTVGIPVVISRLQGLRARHTPSGLPASTLEPSFVVDMLPLRFEDLDAVISEYLQGELDPDASRRIYAKSGGNVGLALALVDASVREGRLAQLDGTVWSAAGELWSSSLRGVIEMHLENLGVPARDALETIAMVGLVDVETVRKLVDWETLELLEERAMIAFTQGAKNNLVSVVPPFIASYFRHAPLSARRIRLTEQIVSKLGKLSSALDLHSGRIAIETDVEEHDAFFAGMLRENLQTRELVAAHEWEASPDVRTASSYVEVLVQGPPALSSELIETVFAQTDPTSGDLLARALYCRLRAYWLAYATGRIDEALELLRLEAAKLSGYGRILDAARVSIHADLRAVPDGYEAELEVAEDAPASVRVALLEAQLHLLTISCRLKDAERVYQELKLVEQQSECAEARALHGIGLLASGFFEEGLRDLTIGLDEARGALDLDAFRTFAGAALYAHIHSGDVQALGDLLDVVFATGELTALPRGTRTPVLAAASLLAAGRGQLALCQKYAELVREGQTISGALPGQDAVWNDVQIEILNGRTKHAADLLWRSAEALRDRGAILAALVGMLAAVEIQPDRTRLSEALRLLRAAPEAVVLVNQGKYLEALANRDAAGLLESGLGFECHGRIGLALAAYARAAQMFSEADDSAAQAKALEHERRLRTATSGRVFNRARFSGLDTALSRREKEVAALATDGLSNAEIAARLVVSVRTVESHMHHIMRKLGVANREALGVRLAEISSSTR